MVGHRVFLECLSDLFAACAAVLPLCMHVDDAAVRDCAGLGLRRVKDAGERAC